MSKPGGGPALWCLFALLHHSTSPAEKEIQLLGHDGSFPSPCRLLALALPPPRIYRLSVFVLCSSNCSTEVRLPALETPGSSFVPSGRVPRVPPQSLGTSRVTRTFVNSAAGWKLSSSGVYFPRPSHLPSPLGEPKSSAVLLLYRERGPSPSLPAPLCSLSAHGSLLWEARGNVLAERLDLLCLCH